MKSEGFYLLSGRSAAGKEREEQSWGHAGEGGRAVDELLPRLRQRHVSAPPPCPPCWALALTPRSLLAFASNSPLSHKEIREQNHLLCCRTHLALLGPCGLRSGSHAFRGPSVSPCFGGCDDKRRSFFLFPKRFIAVSFYTTSLQTERFSSAVARRCIPRVPTVLEKTSSFVAL